MKSKYKSSVLVKNIFMKYESVFSYHPHPTYKIISSEKKENQTIVGWMIYYPDSNCMTLPDPKNLSIYGWMSSCFLFLFFWPLTCLPCCLSDCYEGYQVPLYAEQYSNYEPSAPFEEDIPIAYPIDSS